MKNNKNTKLKISTPMALVLIFLIFAILKISNVVSWGWIWVTFPLWIPLALSISVYFLMVFGIVFVLTPKWALPTITLILLLLLLI